MSFLLSIYNPSPYPRKGPVTVPWQPSFDETNIPPQELGLYDNRGDPLPIQVDYHGSRGPSFASLVFSLSQEVPPGPDDYSAPSSFVTIRQDKSRPAHQGNPRLEIIGPNDNIRVVKLTNDRLSIHFSLVPAPDNPKRNWYAGSAISAQLHEYECLDAFRAIFVSRQFDHDPEKRCMQVDHLRLTRPAWDWENDQQTNLFNWEPHQQIDMFDRRYRLVSSSVGPVRASIIVASKPFDYSYPDPFTGKKRRLICELYRVISLYSDADYVIDELSVHGRPDDNTGSVEPTGVAFTARFFAYMDAGLTPKICQYSHIPDWFAVGSPVSPRQGYGFATNVHANILAFPHPSFPSCKDEHRSFSWELFPCKTAKCLHLFMLHEPKDFGERIGDAWYEQVFKPLTAKI